MDRRVPVSEDHNFAGLLDEAHDLPPSEGLLRPYVLCSTPRTGSTLLSDALTRTGRFGVPAEYLHPDAVTILGKRFGAFSPDGGTLDANRFLAGLVRCRTSADGRFGLKCHFDQLQPFLPTATCRALLARSRFVRVARRDRLAQAVSFEIARQTDLWHVRGEAGDAPAATYDRQRLTLALHTISVQEALWDLFFEANRLRPLAIWYEDMVVDPEAVSGALGAFLEAPRDAAIDLAAPALRRIGSVDKAAWRARFLDELRFAPPTAAGG